MSQNVSSLLYIVSGVLFIMALRGLSHPTTSRQGNLYGMIGMLGVRIWMDNKVNFNNPVNLTAAAVALIAGIGNLTLTVGGVSLEGIAWGSVGIIVAYPIMRRLYETVGEGHDAKY